MTVIEPTIEKAIHENGKPFKPVRWAVSCFGVKTGNLYFKDYYKTKKEAMAAHKKALLKYTTEHYSHYVIPKTNMLT